MTMTPDRQKVDRDEVFLEYTKSICPVCKTVIDGEVNVKDNRVFLRKRCAEHGQFEALLYSGIGLLEATNLSVGRGTETPFEQFGAPWMDGEKVAAALNAAQLPGLKFVPQSFVPVSGLYMGRRCNGVGIRIGDRAAVRAMRLGIQIAVVLGKMYPRDFQVEKTIALLGNSETVQKLESGASPAEIVASWQSALNEFEQTRRKYLLYK